MRSIIEIEAGEALVSAPDPTGEILDCYTVSLDTGILLQLRANAEGCTVWLVQDRSPLQPEDEEPEYGLEAHFGLEDDDGADIELVLQGNYPVTIWGELAEDLARAHYDLLVQQMTHREGTDT